MKKIILLLVSGFSFFFSFSKEVDVATALIVAKNFYSSAATINTSNKQNLIISLAYECKTQSPNATIPEQTAYYIFNVNTDNGFVIVSADDVVKPVLGYSGEGTYDRSNLPPAFQKWMEGYKEQILSAKKNHIEATVEVKKNWEQLVDGTYGLEKASTASVSPLLTTTWNQSPYYNALCPGGSVTGCVATAMAQIMKYWNYPANGTGFHGYNENNYGYLSANFGGTSYNWGSMPNNVTSSNSAVATLMYHCGVSVNMDYGTSSSAQTLDVAYALETYFGYNPNTIQGLDKGNWWDIFNPYYTDAEWHDILINELDNGRPIQYAGSGGSGGHSFVCDGYNNNDYFHFNWGWGGNSDGYFSISNLNPSGSDFNSNHRAVIGIQPLVSNPTYSLKLYNYVTPTPNPLSYAQPFNVTTNIANYGTGAFSGDYCAAIFDVNWNFVDYVQTLTGWTLNASSAYSNDITFSNAGLVSMLPGTYYVGIYFRPTGGNWVSIANNNSYTNFVTLTVYYANDIELNSNIIPSPTQFTQGQSASVNVNIVNDGNTTFLGYYSADLFDLDGNWVEEIQVLHEVNGLQPNYTYNSPYITFNTSSIASNPGTYFLAISHQREGGNWELTGASYHQNPIYVIVKAAPLQPDIYEVNNTVSTPYTFTLNWSGNNANPNTVGSNMHTTTDEDYYKINLPGGYSYNITGRAHDSYNSGNGNTYTNDVIWSYNTGSGWSTGYDDIMNGSINVNGGGSITFYVSPYFAGMTGTYLLDIQITRSLITGLDELTENSFEVYPNPSNGIFTIQPNFEKPTDANIKIFNTLGEIVKAMDLKQVSNSKIEINLDNAAGLYFLEMKTNSGSSTKKIILN
jgi:hypothetical protein